MANNDNLITHILFLEEENTQRTILLEKEVYSIGRYSHNSIKLNSHQVSRHHATLIRKTYGNNQHYYLLIDGNLQGKRSQNGILVNGQTSIRHALKHGDVIVFGSQDVRAIYQREEINDQSLKKEQILLQNTIDPDSIICELDDLSRDKLQNTLISSEKNLSKSLESHNLSVLSSFPELCPYPIVEIDLQGNITYLNPSAKLTFNKLSTLKLQHPLFAGLIDNRETLQGKLLTREICTNGKVYEQYVHYLSQDKLIRSYIFDITKRKESEEMLRYQSLHDSLTGLPNREFFYKELNHLLTTAKYNNQQIALFFVDLDRFKNINDSLNHYIGDKLLECFTQRVISFVDTNIFVSRWGGDEFILIVKNFEEIEEVEKMAQYLKSVIREPFLLESHKLHITMSMGIAVYPRDAQSVDGLIKNADSALYRAKKYGRNNYQFYLPQEDREATFLLKLENSLYQALKNDEFYLCYQPQINVNRKTIDGFEALIRWKNRELGYVSPSKFIPLAEETGLITDIGKWVLETACQQNKAWQDEGLSPFRIAVNLSALQFQQDDFTQTIVKILEKTNLQPQYLELEITEGLLMRDVTLAQRIINDLLEIGVTFSLDDFGTGYSSLSYLKQFPFNTIKIDKSFIQDLSDNKKDLALISAVITIANGFDMNVIAEGVETEEQLKLLQKLKCEMIQGRFFSYPLKTEEVSPFFQKLKANF